jgi:hypothetical protein
MPLSGGVNGEKPKRRTDMHNQSDYGYSLPQIEPRNRKFCLERAAFCDRMAALYTESSGIGFSERAARYRNFAAQWRAEAACPANLPAVSRASHYS